MKITVNIPKNTYTVPTEIRHDVVQHICEAFLDRNAWSVFHPFHQGPYRQATLYVQIRKGKGLGFSSKKDFLGDQSEKIRGCEMAAAFAALQEAGYHMFQYDEFGSWKGYRVSDKPFEQGAVEVHHFADFID